MLSSRTLQRAALRTRAFTNSQVLNKSNRFAGFAGHGHLHGMTSTSSLRSFSIEVPAAPTSSHPHEPLPSARGGLIYTETDEAPALATYSLLPILSKVCI